jgi:hypothetical protein
MPCPYRFVFEKEGRNVTPRETANVPLNPHPHQSTIIVP